MQLYVRTLLFLLVSASLLIAYTGTSITLGMNTLSPDGYQLSVGGDFLPWKYQLARYGLGFDIYYGKTGAMGGYYTVCDQNGFGTNCQVEQSFEVVAGMDFYSTVFLLQEKWRESYWTLQAQLGVDLGVSTWDIPECNTVNCSGDEEDSFWADPYLLLSPYIRYKSFAVGPFVKKSILNDYQQFGLRVSLQSFAD